MFICVMCGSFPLIDLRENCAKTVMDSFDDDDPFEPSSSKDHQKVENVHNLLEDGWFFGKLLSTKPRSTMLRCFSDPSPNFSQENLSENSSTKKVSGNNDLIRTPSLPPYIGRTEETEQESSSRGIKKHSRQLSDQSLVQDQELPIKPIGNCIKKIKEKESDYIMGKMIIEQPLKHTLLLRTPSLPPCLGREEAEEEIEEKDSAITMSRLIRQAMPHTSKGMIQSSSMPKYRPPRNWKVESIDTIKERRNNRNSNQRNLKESLSNLESQVQGFNYLGFTFNKQDLSPRKGGILPRFQHKKNQDQNQDQDKDRGTPCLYEAWNVQNCAPPIPIWAAKNSTQDMKTQLKCWARTVASNVR